ncbi:MAG TPA: IS110 family transposase [Candidatus Brocadiaceae bacterium]|nr:IS110 family transposase [Candidatus Brocadiaceae bacterium]
MRNERKEMAMDSVYRCCCGLDVHKDTVAACLRKIGDDGKTHIEKRTYSTMTKELLALSDWMTSEGVTHVAMESTGVYWKPIWNILEGGFTVLLVNARHIKQVPGRKTDMKDCEWIAQLLQHGLLNASFVPPTPIRELRDLTRHRAKVIGEQATVANRIQKTLEDANIKLASVATDVMGVSGRAMLKAIISGQEDPKVLADLAQRRLRGKIPQLKLALEGRVTEHHRFMLGTLLDQCEYLESLVKRLDNRIEDVMRPFEESVELLKSIPGVEQRTAENLIAEIGNNMDQFPSAEHLASWAGMCPGNNESAGKRKSGKTPKGNRWLRRTLNQSAWAASHTKNTYLSAQYRRLASRRGKKRAIVAVGHTMLKIVYHMLKHKVSYHDLGNDYFDSFNSESLKRNLVKRLEKLGHKVILESLKEVA